MTAEAGKLVWGDRNNGKKCKIAKKQAADPGKKKPRKGPMRGPAGTANIKEGPGAEGGRTEEKDFFAGEGGDKGPRQESPWAPGRGHCKHFEPLRAEGGDDHVEGERKEWAPEGHSTKEK